MLDLILERADSLIDAIQNSNLSEKDKKDLLFIIKKLLMEKKKSDNKINSNKEFYNSK